MQPYSLKECLLGCKFDVLEIEYLICGTPTSAILKCSERDSVTRTVRELQYVGPHSTVFLKRLKIVEAMLFHTLTWLRCTHKVKRENLTASVPKITSPEKKLGRQLSPHWAD
jgi:hypothetical protein